MARAARAAGRNGDARTVLAAAGAAEAWAEDILHTATKRLAAAIAGLQAIADPERIVIGGGVGLADGFLDGLLEALRAHPEVMVPELALAELGADAGIIGAADIAASAP